MRGTKLNTTVHLSDWYATFCELAGIPQTDYGTPDAPINGVDGLSLWPLLSGGEGGDTPAETRRQQLEDKPLLLKNIFSSDGVGWDGAQAIVRGCVRLCAQKCFPSVIRPIGLEFESQSPSRPVPVFVPSRRTHRMSDSHPRTTVPQEV